MNKPQEFVYKKLGTFLVTLPIILGCLSRIYWGQRNIILNLDGKAQWDVDRGLDLFTWNFSMDFGHQSEKTQIAIAKLLGWEE